MATRTRALGLNSLGFAAVTAAAYFSAVVTLGYMLNTFSRVRIVLSIVLAALYLINGLYGYALARRDVRLARSVIYLAMQIAMGATLLLLARSPALMFAMLPLAGQAVVLFSRRLMFVAGVVMWLSLA